MLDREARTRIKAGLPVLGTFVMLPSADVAEIAGRCGFDLVIIDLEHAGKDWSTLQHMVRAVEVSGAAALVRVARQDDAEILRVLELGVAGIVVPFVETAGDARRIADLVRYSPEGSRGTCRFTRAAEHGLRSSDFATLARETNESLIVLGQIESLKGVRNINEILAVEGGFDGFIIGRGDLAADLGRPGEVDHPAVMTEVDRLLGSVLGGSRAALGIVSYSASEAAVWRQRGISLVVHSTDTAVLSDAYRRVVEALRT